MPEDKRSAKEKADYEADQKARFDSHAKREKGQDPGDGRASRLDPQDPIHPPNVPDPNPVG